MVYKLVAREGSDGRLAPVAKASKAKESIGGRKSAARRLDGDGRAVEEVVVDGPDEAVAAWAPAADDLRALVVPLVTDAEVCPGWTGAEGVAAAAARHAASRDELPRGARRLSADEAAIPTVTLTL
jgi:nicotinate phosphoribosyltransferase